MGVRSQSLGGALLLSAVLLAVVLAVVLKGASGQLCPLCECPATYQPVCGKTIDKDGKVKLRGFPSRCVMECNNQCRKAQFEFLKRGRCGPKVPKPVRDPNENEVLDKKIGTNATSSNTTAAPNLKGMATVPAH